MGLEQLLHQGLAAQQRGDQAEAERCYLGVLAWAPHEPNANHFLGVLRYHQGKSAEALSLIGKALAGAPQSPEVHAHYGLALHSAGRPQEALTSLDRALALAPDQAEALNSRGMVLMALGRPQDALLSLDQAVALEPGYGEAWNNRGVALRDLNRPLDARDSFARASALEPGNTHILFNLGLACLIAGKLAEAAETFEKILAVFPDDRPARNNLALALCEAGRTDAAMAHFRRHAELGGAPEPGPELDHKRRHDEEQRAWRTKNPGAAEPGARLPGPAVNPQNDIAGIAERWRTARPQVAVIDNLLTPAGLDALRRYCWHAPVWKKSYDEGYLAALPENGFAAPLLAQIADELRQTYGAIFGEHCLRYLWGFKYDSRLTGVNIHADFAAVNVNFWITADEANLDPDNGGGLIIWDKAAPLDWDFTTYNNDEAAIRAFLEKSGAQAQTVAYRANRAVIFDSDLFHQTGAITFREGYENRRINVTMLYGRRRLHEGRGP